VRGAVFLACVWALAYANMAGASGSASFGLDASGITAASGYSTSASYAVYGCIGLGGGAAQSASFGMQTTCAAAFMSLPADDDDGDGVPNGVEDGGPNGGDANGDGIPDSQQPNVATLPGGDGYVSAVITDGGCASVTSIVAMPAPPDGADAGFRYPFGRVALTLSCQTPGATASVDLYFFGATPWPPVAMRGFGPTPPAFGASTFFPDIATFGTASLPGSGQVPVAHVTLTDGGLGDDTPADGTISALLGPVRRDSVAGAPVEVPALSALAALLMALGVGTLGALARKRR
jgi:hypothetical protein